jgi:hypothetical protein
MRWIIAGLALAFMPLIAMAAQLPDDATISLVVERFKHTLQENGINSVGQDVQNCYDDAGLTEDSSGKIKKCMLYDAAAYRLDKGMRGAMAMRGENLSAAKYFTDKAFNLRLEFYGKHAFGGSGKAANQYLVKPSLQIMNRAVE